MAVGDHAPDRPGCTQDFLRDPPRSEIYFPSGADCALRTPESSKVFIQCVKIFSQAAYKTPRNNPKNDSNYSKHFH